VRPVADTALDNPALRVLDAGERVALALARIIRADLVLMDDRAGVGVARALGIP
jgi:predicted nucleic acid-binding protein